jgi:secreted Zn-dependent insulinase-like peptidase
LEEPVFDCLRTKEQLGYTVHCDHRSTYGVVGFYFNIISASHTTAHLEDRIEHFCNCALSYLKNMSIEEYKKRLKTYSIALSEPHTDLEESADEMWQGVTDRHECFDGIDKRVASSVLSIGKEELVQWWSTYVVAKENRRKLVVCVNAGKVTKHGCSPDNEEKEEHESDSASSDGGEEEEEEEESDEEEEDEEEDFLEFPTTGELSTDWWKIAYPVVELETTDVALFKATLELLPAPVEKQSRTSS